MFKKKGRSSDHFCFPQGCELDAGNSRIRFPKLGWIRYRNSREILGTAKNITVSSNGGKWFVSIQTEREVEPAITKSTSSIGIDVGIARFATMSDGSFAAPLNSFKKHQERLARYQRRMSRKVKFSNNWKKAKTRVQKIHTGIANARKDFLHKTTTTISQNHALVCVEDLQVRNMSRSAKGTVETPGKNVRQKSGLNRAILDQGWGEFRRQGLRCGQRLHVHLSADAATAQKVGERHGTSVVLRIVSGAMAEQGFVLYLSENSVWLTKRVPVRFIEFPC